MSYIHRCPTSITFFKTIQLSQSLARSNGSTMSRVYITASMKHGSLLPTFSVETADHTGGGYTVGGLHPSSIAAMAGKLPEVNRGERFDLKANLNAQRTSLALVVATTKHLPHLEWSSESGIGKLPMGMGAIATALLGASGAGLLGGPSKNSSKSKSTGKSSSKSSSRSSDKRSHGSSRSSEKSRSGDRRRSYAYDSEDEYDYEAPRSANRNQRAIMPREESYKARDWGYEDDERNERNDRYEKQDRYEKRKPSSRTSSRTHSRR